MRLKGVLGWSSQQSPASWESWENSEAASSWQVQLVGTKRRKIGRSNELFTGFLDGFVSLLVFLVHL